jgi:hypothetical protein
MLNFCSSTGFGIDPGLIPNLANTCRTDKKRTPTFSGWGSIKKGDDILSHITAVPSALAGLTTLFGMGRGEPRRNNHLKKLELLWAIIFNLQLIIYN